MSDFHQKVRPHPGGTARPIGRTALTAGPDRLAQKEASGHFRRAGPNLRTFLHGPTYPGRPPLRTAAHGAIRRRCTTPCAAASLSNTPPTKVAVGHPFNCRPPRPDA